MVLIPVQVPLLLKHFPALQLFNQLLHILLKQSSFSVSTLLLKYFSTLLFLHCLWTMLKTFSAVRSFIFFWHFLWFRKNSSVCSWDCLFSPLDWTTWLFLNSQLLLNLSSLVVHFPSLLSLLRTFHQVFLTQMAIHNWSEKRLHRISS